MNTNGNVDPIALALADLRMMAISADAITQGRALEAIRIVSIALANRRALWLPIFIGGMALGALVVVIALIVGELRR